MAQRPFIESPDGSDEAADRKRPAADGLIRLNDHRSADDLETIRARFIDFGEIEKLKDLMKSPAPVAQDDPEYRWDNQVLQAASRMSDYFLNNRSALRRPNEGMVNTIAFFLNTDAIAVAKRYKPPLRAGETAYITHGSLPQFHARLWEMIMPLEPELFGMLKDPSLNFEKLKGYMLGRHQIEIASFDDFYGRLEELLKLILMQKKESRKGLKGLWDRLRGT